MDLKWSCGYTFDQLLRAPELKTRFHCPGVYVQTDHRPGVAYVGKVSGSTGLWLRQYQHYVNSIGGLYKLPTDSKDCDDYAWEPGWDIKGNLETVFNRDLFKKKVVDRAFEYVPAVTIHLCPLASGDEAKIAERELLWVLQPHDTKRGTKSRPQNQDSFVHDCRDCPDLQKLLKERVGLKHSFEPIAL